MQHVLSEGVTGALQAQVAHAPCHTTRTHQNIPVLCRVFVRAVGHTKKLCACDIQTVSVVLQKALTLGLYPESVCLCSLTSEESAIECNTGC